MGHIGETAKHRILMLIAALLSIVFAFLLATCTHAPVENDTPDESLDAINDVNVVAENCPLIKDTDFGGIYIDMAIDGFNSSGFSYGDSVDIQFSNGYAMSDIPYYSNYYVRTGEAFVMGYAGYPHVKIAIYNEEPLWDVSGVTEQDTVTISLREAGKYSDVEQALAISYSDKRQDYSSDVEFANFRQIRTGNIKEGILFRSASPICNNRNRAAYASKFMMDSKIAYDLDLSDNPGEVDAFANVNKADNIDISYFEALRADNKVGYLDLTVNFASPQFRQSLASGLSEMSKHDGPYLVHCVEGKDRTGFVCTLLEALTIGRRRLGTSVPS